MIFTSKKTEKEDIAATDGLVNGKESFLNEEQSVDEA